MTFVVPFDALARTLGTPQAPFGTHLHTRTPAALYSDAPRPPRGHRS